MGGEDARLVDAFGRTSKAQSLRVKCPGPPLIYGVEITAGTGEIDFVFPPMPPGLGNMDYAVWIFDTPGVPLDTASLSAIDTSVYIGTGASFTLDTARLADYSDDPPMVSGETYYVRYAVVDDFAEDAAGFNISVEQAVTVL